jgi:hypothetical protein
MPVTLNRQVDSNTFLAHGSLRRSEAGAAELSVIDAPGRGDDDGH